MNDNLGDIVEEAIASKAACTTIEAVIAGLLEVRIKAVKRMQAAKVALDEAIASEEWVQYD